MSEKIKTALAILIILLILPYIITYAIQGNILFEIGQDHASKMDRADEPTETLVGILANQISMDAPNEAIKAQAVIVRTEYYRRQESGTEQEKSLSMDELVKLWGNNRLQTNYEIAKKAVDDTAGEVLTYEKGFIQTAFHKVSAGATRAADHLNGEETPYLTSVSCGTDITSPDYLAVRFFPDDEFAETLGLSADIDFNETQIITDADEAGYVKTVTIGDFSISGDELRSTFDLPSPCFYIKEVEGQIRIVTKGMGHGIGLSQYAACELAKGGSSYEEILKYFFIGSELEKN